MNKTDKTLKVSSTERSCGVRATFHVYYRKGGKLYFDPAFDVPTENAAIERVKGFARGLGDVIEVVEAVRLKPVAGPA